MNPWRGLGSLPKEVWALFTVSLINRMGTMVLPFLVIYLTKSLGFSAGQAGLAIMVYGIGSLVSSPLAGRLCDWVGPLRIMKISLLASGAILLLFPLAKSFIAVLLITFIWSVINESFRPAILSIVTDVVTAEQRRPAFSLIRLAINLGMSIGPVIGGFLATVSFTALFLVDGVTSILAGLVLFLLSWQFGSKLSEQEKRDESTIDMQIGPASVLSDSRLIYFLVAVVPIGIVFFQQVASMPLFLVRELQMSESIYGLILSINTLLIILLEVPLNMAMAHWSHRHTLVLGTLLCGIGFGSLTFATGFLSIAATVVVWTFGEMILLPAMSAYIADIAPSERRGQYMGLYTMAFSLAYIGSSIGPWILVRFGASVLWSAAFVFSLVSSTMMARVHTKQPEY